MKTNREYNQEIRVAYLDKLRKIDAEVKLLKTEVKLLRKYTLIGLILKLFNKKIPIDDCFRPVLKRESFETLNKKQRMDFVVKHHGKIVE